MNSGFILPGYVCFSMVSKTVQKKTKWSNLLAISEEILDQITQWRSRVKRRSILLSNLQNILRFLIDLRNIRKRIWSNDLSRNYGDPEKCLDEDL